MWRWASTELVPVDAFDPRVAAEGRQRLRDALEPPAEPADAGPAVAVPQRPAEQAEYGNRNHAGLAPSHIPAPSWWKGDRGAFSTTVQAAGDLGYRGEGIPSPRPATPRPAYRRPSSRHR